MKRTAEYFQKQANIWLAIAEKRHATGDHDGMLRACKVAEHALDCRDKQPALLTHNELANGWTDYANSNS